MSRNVFIATFLFLTSLSWGQKDTSLFHLLFAGDVMGHGPQIKGAYYEEKAGYNYDSCFVFVKPIVQRADLAIANLEVTLAGPEYKGYPQFSSPDELADGLRNTGFDLIVTANNHSVDRGDDGIKRTIEVLEEKKLLHTGTFIDTVSRIYNYPFILEQDSIKFAFLNTTYGTNGLVAKKHIVNYIDSTEILKDIATAKKNDVDLIVMVVHWGKEYQRKAGKDQRSWAKFFFDNGVDIVLGSHPHVVQEIEADTVISNGDTTYKNLIFYSHGNFISNQRDRYKDGGIMGHVFLKKVDDKVVVKDFAYTSSWVRKKEEGKLYRYYCVAPSEVEKLKLSKEEKEKYDEFTNDTRSHLKGIQEVK